MHPFDPNCSYRCPTCDQQAPAVAGLHFRERFNEEQQKLFAPPAGAAAATRPGASVYSLPAIVVGGSGLFALIVFMRLSHTGPAETFAGFLFLLFEQIATFAVTLMIFRYAWRKFGLVIARFRSPVDAPADAELADRTRRYYSLRYCDFCHIIFDADRRSEVANADGFAAMLKAA